MMFAAGMGIGFMFYGASEPSIFFEDGVPGHGSGEVSASMSSAFIPLIGERWAAGWLGRFIDIVSIVATVFGTACSLGLGVMQIGAGLSASGIVEDPGMLVIIGVVAVLTLALILSVSPSSLGWARASSTCRTST